MNLVKKIISSATWVIFVFLFLFTVLAGISQSSAPGDRTYGIKIAFEKGLLAFYSLFDKEANLQIQLTNNRAKEFSKVLASNQAQAGISNLNIQIEETKKSIDSIKDSQEKIEVSEKYISTLEQVSVQLDEDKKSLQSNTTTTFQPTIVPFSSTQIPTKFILPTTKLSQPTPTFSPTPPPQPIPTQDVTVAIDQTQNKIQETIEELKKIKDKKNDETDQEEKMKKNKLDRRKEKND